MYAHDKEKVLLTLAGAGTCVDNVMTVQFGAGASALDEAQVIGGELTGALREPPLTSFGIWQVDAILDGETQTPKALYGYWRSSTTVAASVP